MARQRSQATKKAAGAGRTCVDRIIPGDYHPAHAEAHRTAIQHARRILAMAAPGQLNPATIIQAKMALVNAKKWPTGRTLRCRFLDGSKIQQKKVQAKAHLWEAYAKIKFQFVATGDAEIRISFSADPGSWSGVGNDCLVEEYFPKYQPTMNFGWLQDGTEDREYERVVLHEFGHALGCLHEHQSPRARLKWDKQAVYRYFSGAPNYWNKKEIDQNVLERYSPEGITASAFDVHSIMLYQFDASLFTDHKPTPLNYQLSAHDKQLIASMYPK